MAYSSAIPAEPVNARQEAARIAALRRFNDAGAWFRAHEREIAERQLEFTRIPAPPFGEAVRGEWLRDRFLGLGLSEVRIDAVGNVLGIRPGSDSEAPLLAVTAHIDTVFPAGTPLDVRREGVRLLGPGISDNGAGVSALLAVLEAMNAAALQTRAPLLFVGNVGEEGEGDLRGMRHLFQSSWAEQIGRTLVLDGAATDTISAEAVGSRRFEVVIHGPGGHSWSDFGAANPISALARGLARFVGTSVPQEPKTTFNVGVIHGGTSVNSIPESAAARIDLRSASTEQLDRLETLLRDAIEAGVNAEQPQGTARAAHALSVEFRPIGSRPAADLAPDAYILQVIHAVDAQLGNNARLQRASTDANIPLSMGREAIAIGGGGTGGGAHTIHEWYDPTGRDLGLRRILLTLLVLAGVEE